MNSRPSRMVGVEGILQVISGEQNAELREELECMTKMPAFQPLLKFLESRVEQLQYVTNDELKIDNTREGVGAVDGDASLTVFPSNPRNLGGSGTWDVGLLEKEINAVSSKMKEVNGVLQFLTKQLNQEQESILATYRPSEDLLAFQQEELQGIRNEFEGNLNRASTCVDALIHNLESSDNGGCSVPLEEFLERAGALQRHLNLLKNEMVDPRPESIGLLENNDSVEFLSTELDRSVNTLVPIERRTLELKAKIFSCENALNYLEEILRNSADPFSTPQNDSPRQTDETVAGAVQSCVNHELREHKKCIMKDVLNRQEMTIKKLGALNNAATTLRLSCDALRFMISEELTYVNIWRSLLSEYKVLLEQFSAKSKTNIWLLQWMNQLGRSADAPLTNFVNVPSMETRVRENINLSEPVLKASEGAAKMCEFAQRLHSLLFSSVRRNQIEDIRVTLRDTLQRYQALIAKLKNVERQYEAHKDYVELTPYLAQKDRFWIDFVENRSKLVNDVAKLEEYAKNLQIIYEMKLQDKRTNTWLNDFA